MIEYAPVVAVVLLLVVVVYLHIMKQRLDKLHSGLKETEWEYVIDGVFLKAGPLPLLELKQSLNNLGRQKFETVAVWANPETEEGTGISVLLKRPVAK
jgi:hypothetical protein